MSFNGNDSDSKILESYKSPAAFVESGVQDSYDDTCSICLETFTEEEPSTLTSCKHQFHLQCILEWAQRSQECPMCWQALSLVDSDSQELLDACAQERLIRQSQSVSPPNFLRFPLEDERVQRFTSSFSEEGSLDRRIMQHLAGAAANMSRGRGGHLGALTAANESSQQRAMPAAVGQRVSIVSMPETGNLIVGPDNSGRSGFPSSEPRVYSRVGGLSMALNQGSSSSSRQTGSFEAAQKLQGRPQQAALEGTSAGSASSPTGGSGEGSGDQQSSLGDVLKMRWAAASKYRDSLSKSTRSFRDRFRLRSGAVADFSAKAREVGAGVVRVLERMADPGPSGATDSALSNPLTILGSSFANMGLTRQPSDNLESAARDIDLHAPGDETLSEGSSHESETGGNSPATGDSAPGNSSAAKIDSEAEDHVRSSIPTA